MLHEKKKIEEVRFLDENGKIWSTDAHHAIIKFDEDNSITELKIYHGSRISTPYSTFSFQRSIQGKITEVDYKNGIITIILERSVSEDVNLAGNACIMSPPSGKRRSWYRLKKILQLKDNCLKFKPNSSLLHAMKDYPTI